MTNTPKFWGAFLYIYIMGSKDTHTDTDDNRLTAELYIDEKSRTLILKIRDFRDDVSAVVAARLICETLGIDFVDPSIRDTVH
tara:strand:+ start:1170 stop:1418 length:249 start_codon:yes stop_codon:yes gene_type:complete